ncbi:MAG: tyramine oxidase, partial [Hyphomicrobiales bacterium]
MAKRTRISWTNQFRSVAVGAFLVGISVSAFAGDHPLDGLSTDEITRVVSILKNEKKAADGALFSLIELFEPDKSFVLAWKEGEAIPRKAMAHFRSNGELINAVVDINAGKVENSEPLKGQPMILLAEFINSMEAALGDEIFIEGLAKRGLKPADVFCLPLTAGNFGVEAEAGKRLMKVPCYANPSGSNFYAKPIEGLFATVDLATKRVLEVVDEKEYPIPEDGWGYTEAELEKRFGALRPKTNPATLQQPGGANFEIDGGGVTWDMWSFRYRTDKRPGMVLSDIKVKDGDKERQVLY